MGDNVVVPFRLIARDRYHPRPNETGKSCYIDVEGAILDGMQDAALDRAAQFLGEKPVFLYISSASTARVVAYERWQPHLGVELRPTRWAVTFTVKLDPLIADQRRSKNGPVSKEPAEEETDGDG